MGPALFHAQANWDHDVTNNIHMSTWHYHAQITTYYTGIWQKTLSTWSHHPSLKTSFARLSFEMDMHVAKERKKVCHHWVKLSSVDLIYMLLFSHHSWYCLHVPVLAVQCKTTYKLSDSLTFHVSPWCNLVLYQTKELPANSYHSLLGWYHSLLGWELGELRMFWP